MTTRAGDDVALLPLQQLLADGGVNLFTVIPAATYDATAAPALRSAALLPGARSVIVLGSGGRQLWDRFTAWLADDLDARLRDHEHPLERYVRGVIEPGIALLTDFGHSTRCFEPTLSFQPRLDFRILAELAGLGSRSPLGMVVHPAYGPWWALRGALFTDATLSPTRATPGPCPTCDAPCRRHIAPGDEGTLAAATRVARSSCVVGAHRYTDEQLDYHYEFDDAARREQLRALMKGRR